MILSGPAFGQQRHDQGLHQVRVEQLILEGPEGTVGEVARLAGIARRMLPRLEEELGVRAQHPFRIVLMPNHRQVPAGLARLDQRAQSWAAGFLVPEERIGVLRLGKIPRYPYDDTSTVLAHEIAHMLLHDAAGGVAIPRWFGEGVASRQGSRWGWRDRRERVVSVMSRGLPSLADLDADFSSSSGAARRAYAASFDFVRWSSRRYGDEFVKELLDELPQRDFEEAWRLATGADLETSERRWRRSTLLIHRWIPLLASSGFLWVCLAGLAVVAGTNAV